MIINNSKRNESSVVNYNAIIGSPVSSGRDYPALNNFNINFDIMIIILSRQKKFFYNACALNMFSAER